MANPRKKSRKEQPPPESKAAPAPSRLDALAAWLRAHSLAAVIVLAVIATLRIVATYSVFNHTSDEPAHVACGMEWLERGSYTFEPQHPPLARIATAIGPYFAGCRLPGRDFMGRSKAEAALFNYVGADVLYWGKQYMRNLTLARLGVMPFFWLAVAVVYLWARRSLGPLEAVLAVFLFTFLPPVLAHAGLATTDMPVTATLGAAFLAGLIWVERPAPAAAALFGACAGVALLCKFSTLAFLPSAIAAALIAYVFHERPGTAVLLDAARKRLPTFALAVAAGAVVIWAGYRFSFSGGLPAPSLWSGIHDVMEHNRLGHPSYLLGERSMHGWWYYYLVILAVKTPLAFLALLFLGIAYYKRTRGAWLPLAFSAGILLFSLTSGINIGVRHVLPVYIGFSLVAAAGAVRLLETGARAKWAYPVLAVAFVWMAGTSLLSHPDYLPYFNAIAGDEPEKIAVDSDLDWGQDLNRVGKRLHEVGAPSVATSAFVVARLEAMHGFPPTTRAMPQAPAPGWNAISITVLRATRMGLLDTQPEITPWPEKIQPLERIGKGMWLYYFPPQPR
jgi:hypothetical protein